MEQAHGPEVDVKIETAPHAEQNVFRVFVGRDSRIAERSGKNRIEVPTQHFEGAFRQTHFLTKKLFRAPVEVDKLEFERFGFLQVPQHANGLTHHFRADSVTRNDCDSFHSQHIKTARKAQVREYHAELSQPSNQRAVPQRELIDL